MISRLKDIVSFRGWCVIALIISIPALLVHLGVMPFIEDESIRALVALEMDYSGNFLVPTLNTTLYFSKPPLYNWIIYLSYSFFGQASEFTARLPTVIWTFTLSFLVYFFSKDRFEDKKLSVLAGLFTLTCGRILFWDSFLGLIDIGYSAVIFTLIMWIYREGERKRYTSLFIVVYLLGAVGYMMKGLPTFLFIGWSLLSYAMISHSFKWLFHKSHFVGILLLAALVATYYYFYDLQSDAFAKQVRGLTIQSTMRTPLHFGVWPVIKHVFTYPFEYIYHYLPWTLFALLMVRKDAIAIIRRNKFFAYVALSFLTNILVYWISPQVYARYVLMLVPPSYLLFLYFYEQELQYETWRIKVIRTAFLIIVLALPILVMLGGFNSELQTLENGRLILIALALLLVLLAVLYWQIKAHRLMLLIIVLLTVRVGFNLLVLPIRASSTYGMTAKKEAQRVGEQYRDDHLQLYQSSKLDYTGSFYLSNIRGSALTRSSDTLQAETYYMVDTSKYDIPIGATVVDSIKKREFRHTLYIVKKASVLQ